MAQIQSVKLQKSGTLTVTYNETILPSNQEEESYIRNIIYESDLTVHPDLFNALQAFLSPMVIICEVVDEKKAFSDNEEEHDKILNRLQADYTVKGIHFSERKEVECFIITGQKKLSTGKKMNLVTPLTSMDDLDFPGGDEIDKLKELLIVEVEKYIFNGKHGGPKQGKLDLNDQA